MKDILIIANLKMKMIRRRDVVTYCDQLRKNLVAQSDCKSGVSFVVCPSAPHYDVVARAMHVDSRIALGAQDVFWERRGSYTGEISPLTLVDSDVRYALVGHSEQRTYGHLTDMEVGKKVQALLQAEITPVIFVGENAHERESGHMKDVITAHLHSVVQMVRAQDIGRCIFVYEPIWAVGGTQTPTAEEIMSARILMQKILTDAYDAQSTRAVRFLYGGSVTPENAILFTSTVGMHGVVVGRAALSASALVRIGATIVRNYQS